MKTKFPCTKCGICCKIIGRVFSAEGLEALDLSTNEDGSCVHYINNECSIYEQRPIICQVGHEYLVDYDSSNWKPAKYKIPWQEYYIRTAVTCNQLMDQEDSPAERIDIIKMAREFNP